MAALLRTATAFRTSRSLFRRQDDYSPITFYFGCRSDDLEYIIHNGGGCLVNDQAEAEYFLCEKKTDNKINEGYLPLDFIVECVKKNSFLNVDSYRTNTLGLRPSTSRLEPSVSSADLSDDEENMVKISTTSRISAAGLLGRKKYTDLEDLKIIRYLINHDKCSETGGNVVWKLMENLQITDHPYQSMKSRFQKKIIPEIDTYDIPADWKAKLCGNYSDDGSDHNKGLREEVDSFDNIEIWKNHEKMLKPNRVIASTDKSSPSINAADKKCISRDASSSEMVSNCTSLLDQQLPAVAVVAEVHSDGLCSLTTPLAEMLPDTLESAQHQDVQIEYSETVMDINEEIFSEKDVYSPENESPNYVYDEMDLLLISEANRNKNLHETDKSNELSSGSNAAVIKRKRSKEINDCDSDEVSSAKIRNVSSDSSDNKERKTRYIQAVNSPARVAKNSSERESVTDHINSNGRQEVSSDGQVKDISKKNKTSGNKILPINGEKSPNARARKRSWTPKDSNLEVKNCRNFAQNKHQLNEKTVLKNNESRSVTQEIDRLDIDTVKTLQEMENVLDKVGHDRPSKNSSLKSNKGNKKVPRHSGSMPQANSDVQMEDEISAEPVRSVSVTKKTSSSSKINKSFGSTDNSSDISNNDIYSLRKQKSTKKHFAKTGLAHNSSASSDSYSPHKRKNNDKQAVSAGLAHDSSPSIHSYSPHKRKSNKQAVNAGPAHNSAAVDKTSVEGTSKNQNTAVEDVPSDLYIRESIIRQVKYLSEEYGFDLEEAARLLKIHDGSFRSVIQFLEPW